MKRAKYISNGTITYKIIGEQGPQGPQGPAGPQGPQGPKGDSSLDVVNELLEHKADKSELAVERRRIDNIIALPDGSTTSDAELVDMRIDVDGNTHGSAGSATRWQIMKTLDSILGVKDSIENIANLPINHVENVFREDKVFTNVVLNKGTNYVKVNGNGGVGVILCNLNKWEVSEKKGDGVSTNSAGYLKTYYPTWLSDAPIIKANEKVYIDFSCSGTIDTTQEICAIKAYDVDGTRITNINPNPDKQEVTFDKDVYSLVLIINGPAINVTYDNYTVELKIKTGTKITLNKNIEIPQITKFKRPELTVASWNIAHFGNGTSPNPSGTDENLQKYRDTIVGFDCDVLLLCENDPEYKPGVNNDTVYRYFKNYESGDKREYNCNSVATQLDVISIKTIEFTQKYQDRYFFDTVVDCGGKELHCISTQAEWYDVDLRKSQLEQLIAYMNQFEYCVLGGDFNTSCRVNGQYPTGSEVGHYNEDYQLFLDAGYNIANNDYFGMLGTNKISLPWDNIITSPKIRIRNVSVVNDGLSDHKPIITKLILE